MGWVNGAVEMKSPQPGRTVPSSSRNKTSPRELHIPRNDHVHGPHALLVLMVYGASLGQAGSEPAANGRRPLWVVVLFTTFWA